MGRSARLRRGLSRRDIVRAALVGAAGAALPVAACGRGPSGALTTTEIADGVVMVAGAGGNVVGVRGPDGIAMIDGGLAAHAEDLRLTAARALGSRAIPVLFNTHWHREQTGLNAVVGGNGDRIIAHENTRLWLGAEVDRRWEETVYEPLPEIERPNETIYTQASLAWGDHTIDYGYMLQAHTDGDIYVHVKTADVLVTGGPVSNGAWPVIDWTTCGWIGGQVRAIERLIALSGENTVIVPSDGAPMRRADLERHLAMYTDLRDKLRQAWQKSHGIEEVLTQGLAAPYEAEMGDPTLYLRLAYKSWWGHVREMSVV